MKLKTTILAACATAAACVAAHAADPYKVLVPLGEDFDGAMAYITDLDTGADVDSVLVADGAALFSGSMDEPFAARVTVDGRRYAQFIMEPGSISFSEKTRRAFGSQLNDQMRAIEDSISDIERAFTAAPDEAARKVQFDRYIDFMGRQLKANADNPIGYQIFLDQASALSAAELDSALAAYPEMLRYKRVAKLRDMNLRRNATAVGSKFVDFEVNGQKLSDYVGKDGRYLLVDFWASWCGPCIRQTVVIKDLKAKYADKGLDVLGVAVWDKPEDTRAAIKSHELDWPCIVDAQTIPTDLYGISGIPCIMLIGPDGTILSRDKQDDELRADVARYLDR